MPAVSLKAGEAQRNVNQSEDEGAKASLRPRAVILGGERELLEALRDDRHRGRLAEEQDALGSVVARQLAQLFAIRRKKSILRKAQSGRDGPIGPMFDAEFVNVGADGGKGGAGNERLNFRQSGELVEVGVVAGSTEGTIQLESVESRKELLGKKSALRRGIR
jgi:hypothetical protein